MNVAIFRNIAPCSPYVNRCFGGMYHLHLQGVVTCCKQVSCSADLRPQRWRCCDPPNRRFTYGLHGAVSQKIATLKLKYVKQINIMNNNGMGGGGGVAVTIQIRFEKFSVRVSAGAPAIPTEAFCGFFQFLPTNSEAACCNHFLPAPISAVLSSYHLTLRSLSAISALNNKKTWKKTTQI
jgi:hypothetical protein